MKNEMLNEVVVRFVADCGGAEFVRKIASGHNPCLDQKIVAAAKATVCEIERIKGSEA